MSNPPGWHTPHVSHTRWLTCVWDLVGFRRCERESLCVKVYLVVNIPGRQRQDGREPELAASARLFDEQQKTSSAIAGKQQISRF